MDVDYSLGHQKFPHPRRLLTPHCRRHVPLPSRDRAAGASQLPRRTRYDASGHLLEGLPTPHCPGSPIREHSWNKQKTRRRNH